MTTNLTTAIIRIVTPHGLTAGAGFVLSDSLAVTCAHVIAAAGSGPGETVRLVFHATGSESAAIVEPAGWRDPLPAGEDIAILRLTAPLPAGVTSLPLGVTTGLAGEALESYGFPDLNPAGGLPGRGELIGSTTLDHGAPVLLLRSPEITGGYSGGPAWHPQRRQVVGIVLATADPDARGRHRDSCFIIPAERLQAA
ncbi:MAG: hypothetical protein FOGNACKC_04595 [Anaerolineae bacterium]|nr:hypothetical protein [Anaerolineae bacterium]